MARIVHMGIWARFMAFLFGSTRRLPYAKPTEEIEQSLAAFSFGLQRAAGVAIPASNPSGSWWLLAGRIFSRLSALALLSVPLLLGLSIVSLIAGRGVAFGLVSSSDPGLVAVILVFLCVLAFFATVFGNFMMQRGKRQLMLVPLALSKAVTSVRHTRAARHLRLGSIVMIPIGAVMAMGGQIGRDVSLSKNPPTDSFGVLIGQVPFIVWLFVAAVGACLFFGGVILFRRAARMMQPTADEVALQDPRKPVVFLRSFHDDDEKIQMQMGKTERGPGQSQRLEQAIFDRFLPWGLSKYKRLEEAISDQFSPFGPMVGIGKPEEGLPELGAARNYYSDAEWRPAVAKWLDQALLIVAVAGITPGLRWELDKIGDGGHFRKLLILMPRSNQRSRWEIMRGGLAAHPVFAGLPETMPKGLLCLHVAPDGEVVMVTADGALETTYESAIQLAIYGMFCHERAEAAADRTAAALAGSGSREPD